MSLALSMPPCLVHVTSLQKSGTPALRLTLHDSHRCILRTQNSGASIPFAAVKYGPRAEVQPGLIFVMDRTVGNLLEQTPPFLLGLWLHAMAASPEVAGGMESSGGGRRRRRCALLLRLAPWLVVAHATCELSDRLRLPLDVAEAVGAAAAAGHPPMWTTAAEWLRPIRPPARPASVRFKLRAAPSLGRPRPAGQTSSGRPAATPALFSTIGISWVSFVTYPSYTVVWSLLYGAAERCW